MKRLLALAAALAACGCNKQEAAPKQAEAPKQEDATELRVCADPNNLPFSNRAGEGFENKIVDLIARDLGLGVRYTWWAQRRGNVRETLNERMCDLIPGVATELEMLATTPPYYRSTYVSITRAGAGAPIASFDDPRLRHLKVGVQMVGDDFSNTPPAHALTARGMIGNVRGYMIYGDYARPDVQADIVRAVASGEVDVAFVWGPVAAYYAPRQSVPLRLTPVQVSPAEARQMPMTYSVSMGMRRREPAFKARIEAVLARRAPEIRRILADYRVPLVAEGN